MSEAAPSTRQRIWLVVSEAQVLVDRAVDGILAGIGADPKGFDTTLHRGNDADIDDALSSARTPPFLSPARVVVVRDLQLAPDRFFTSLQNYLEHPSPTTALVLAGQGWPKVVKGGRAWNQVVTKAVAAVGEVVSFSRSELDPTDFAMAHAGRLGARLSRSDASHLVAIVGTDLGQIAREVEKVALYVEEGAPLDATAIDAACSQLATDAAWALANAMQSGDTADALATLARALDEGAAPEMLFHQVARPTRILLRMADGLRRGVSVDRMREDLRLPGHVFRAALAAAKAHRADTHVVLDRVAKAHRSMHSSRAGADHTLEGLVLDLLTR